MFNNLPLHPEAASTVARDVDGVYFFLVLMSLVLTIIVGLCIFVFSIKYRRRPGNEIPVEYQPWDWLENAFSGAMLAIFILFFLAGAKLYFTVQRAPKDAMNIYATGRQWMWKFQHPTGQSEINQLHVPVGRPIKLTMASEDVIHSFYVPAFRVKRDVLPSRFTETWFEATKTGTFHLFCTEYCGTEHSGMIGSVVVMEPAAYQQWLTGGPEGGDPVKEGEKLFTKLACNTCHAAQENGRAPVLAAAAGKPRQLAGGQTVLGDDAYIRESILNPRAKLVAGYEPIMPSFQGQVSEEQVMQLITYIKSQAPTGATPAATGPAQPPTPAPANAQTSNSTGAANAPSR